MESLFRVAIQTEGELSVKKALPCSLIYMKTVIVRGRVHNGQVASLSHLIRGVELMSCINCLGI